jgi:hypothetical protein
VLLLLLLLFAGGTAVATRRADIAQDADRSPVRFAAEGLSAPPPGALDASPKDWPALVPDCTAAFLHAGIAAAAPNTTVVSIDVPAGGVTSLRGCKTAAGQPMGHVRLVLAMGRGSAVALDAWDVELGGVTIEGPAGAPDTLIDALVVVRAASRIITRTSAARAALSGPEHDVHALSVVMKSGATALVSGLGLVVTDGSVVRAEHDGAGVLYASAGAVRAESAATMSTDPSLTMTRVRIAVAAGSTVEAVATRSGASYEASRARRAHAATVQILQGARVEASRFLVAVLNGSSVAASGDDGSAAAGGIAVYGAFSRGTTTRVGPTTSVAVSHFVLVAAGPHTSVRVTTKGHGIGCTAMGVAAAAARGAAAISNATLYAVGPNTTVAVHVGLGTGHGASAAMGVAAYADATASMTDAAVYAVGPNTTVGVRWAFKGRGNSAAAFALDAAARSNEAVRASDATGYPSPSARRP